MEGLHRFSWTSSATFFRQELTFVHVGSASDKFGGRLQSIAACKQSLEQLDVLQLSTHQQERSVRFAGPDSAVYTCMCNTKLLHELEGRCQLCRGL